MARIYEDNSRSIGRTPLVELRRLAKGAGARVLAKIEGRNPAYSVKCRIGASMVWDAEEQGLWGRMVQDDHCSCPATDPGRQGAGQEPRRPVVGEMVAPDPSHQRAERLFLVDGGDGRRHRFEVGRLGRQVKRGW